MNPIAHTEINVKDLEVSSKFWSRFLSQLGWKQFDAGHSSVTGFKASDDTHIFLVQTEENVMDAGHHRKRIGLNHLALRVDSPERVDSFATFLKESNIPILYGGEPKDYSSEYGRVRYYALYFEDPDKIKLEVVFYK